MSGWRGGEGGANWRREGKGRGGRERDSPKLRCVRGRVCVEDGRRERKLTSVLCVLLKIRLVSSHANPALLALPVAPSIFQFLELDPWISL